MLRHDGRQGWGCRCEIGKFSRPEHTFCGSKHSGSCNGFFHAWLQWYSSSKRQGMSKSEKFMLHIYAFTITIMFIVLCHARHVALRCQGNSMLARQLRAGRRCFPMRRGVRCFAVLVSWLSFFLERGSLSESVVAKREGFFYFNLLLMKSEKTSSSSWAFAGELSYRVARIASINRRITKSLFTLWIIYVWCLLRSEKKKLRVA